jgi:hypothetical protein
MNRIFTFALVLFVSFLNKGIAQIEQVSVGAAYAQQAYYNLSTGEVTAVDNDAWDIAFSNEGMTDAGVFINESAGFMASPLKLFLSTETDWNNPITDVSVFVDEEIILNSEVDWTTGAFNTVADPANPFDYGWGAYNTTTHKIEGDKIFVVQLRDGSFIKVQITELSGGSYSFKYADLDGSNEVSTNISKEDSAGQSLIYFSFGSGDEVSMPTDYDLVFQRYSTPIPDGMGGFIDYNVTGVLLAPNTSAVVAYDVDPETVNESDYADQYSTEVSTIGYDWKSYSFTSGWVIDDARANFIKTSAGDLYKVVFYDFEGSSTGVTTLEKTFLGTTNTSIANNIDALDIFPNPTNGLVSIKGLEDSSMVSIYAINGKEVIRTTGADASGAIDLSLLADGAYKVVVRNGNQISEQTLILSK